MTIVICDPEDISNKCVRGDVGVIDGGAKSPNTIMNVKAISKLHTGLEKGIELDVKRSAIAKKGEAPPASETVECFDANVCNRTGGINQDKRPLQPISRGIPLIGLAIAGILLFQLASR